jgi:hypothetical protein
VHRHFLVKVFKSARQLRIMQAALSFLALTAASAEAEVAVRLDTSLADYALALTCSNQPVDEALVRASPLVQAQIRHNARLRDTATMDNYIAALRALSACQAPTPDPFAVSDIISNPDAYRRKVEALRQQQDDLAEVVAAHLARYMPDGDDYRGEIVLAVPYYSCGGFADQGRFFIDIRCLDEDIDVDFAALTALVAHETYHAIQARYFFPVGNYEDIRTRNDALTLVLGELLHEGSATHVASQSALPASDGGLLTRINRRFRQDNAQRMGANFALMTMLIEQVARTQDFRAAAESVSQIAFSGGTFQEMGYFVGARMAHDIEAAWGVPALVCVMRLPPEQFALAHDAVAEAGGAQERLGPRAISAARDLARNRRSSGSFRACQP